MQCDYTGVRVVYGTTYDVRLRTVAIHMEVDCIASNNLRLPSILKLDVLNAGYAAHARACAHACARLAVHHQVPAVVCCWRICRITAYVYVTRQYTDLGAHWECYTTILFVRSIMLVDEWRGEGQHCASAVN